MYKTRQGKALTLDDIPNCSLSDQKTLILLSDDDVDLSILSAAIEESPTLTASIIGLANSAYFGSPVQVFTVQDATIKVLGIQTVKSLAISIILGSTLDLRRCAAFSPLVYWTHALTTACCSQYLVKSPHVNSELNADQAYLCGLLSDFGQLLLAHLFPAEQSSVLSGDHQQLSDLLADQQQQMGTDQGIAGSLLATRWKLPPQVKTVIEHHHDPSYRSAHWKLNHVVGFAAQLIRNLQCQTDPDPLQIEPNSPTEGPAGDAGSDDWPTEADSPMQVDLTGLATDQLPAILGISEPYFQLLVDELPSIYDSISCVAEHFAGTNG
jgi:HD-like signal output (HDOD) protein